MVSEGHLTATAGEPMKARHLLAIIVLTVCTAAEGFDVYAIAFAAPGIAQAWQIDQASLGIVLAMDLVGMGLGSFLLGFVADRLGRRPTIICCLLIMAAGMWTASVASDTVRRARSDRSARRSRGASPQCRPRSKSSEAEPR
jgi:MFS family permease